MVPTVQASPDVNQRERDAVSSCKMFISFFFRIHSGYGIQVKKIFLEKIIQNFCGWASMDEVTLLCIKELNLKKCFDIVVSSYSI